MSETTTPRRCYCGGPEEQVYGHAHGTSRHCRTRIASPDQTAVERGADAISDLLTMLGVDPAERPEHGGPTTAETLSAAVLQGIKPDAEPSAATDETATDGFAGWLATVIEAADPNLAVVYADTRTSSFGVVTRRGHTLHITVREG